MIKNNNDKRAITYKGRITHIRSVICFGINLPELDKRFPMDYFEFVSLSNTGRFGLRAS